MKYQISWLAGKIAYPKTWYTEIFAVKEKNQVLQSQVVQLTLLNSELENYRLENERLKQMLNFAQSQPLHLMAGNVVNQNYGLPTRSITIDLGKDEGIEKNLSVLDENGLLGKTIQIGKKASLIQLITDKNCCLL